MDSLEILFYWSSSGRSCFEDFLKDLSAADKALVLAVFEDIRIYGFKALGCQFRQIRGRIWEIKIRSSSGGYRFFYATVGPKQICILHCYKKQSQKAPVKEIEIALRRLKEIL